MKLNCSKEILLDMVNTVQKAVMIKSTMPVLECIKLDCSGDGNVIMTGNNLELCIDYNTVCNVNEGGTVALKSKMFGEIVRRLPEGMVTITTDPENYVTKIKCGLSEFNIQGISSVEFPSVPKLTEIYRFSIEQAALKRIIRKTISFVSPVEGKKPILTGALFEINDGVLNVVASDGHRLAVVKHELNDMIENNKIVIPGMALREILKLLKDEGDVTVIVSDRHVLFDFGYYKIYARLLDGDFLKYEAIINVVSSINVVCDRELLNDSLERAMLLISEEVANGKSKKVPVRFNIGYNKIDISCITGKGQVNDTVDVQMDGGDLTIGFNCRFLLDALAGCDGEKVKMEFSAPTSGGFIRSAEGDDSYVYMILPVRLN